MGGSKYSLKEKRLKGIDDRPIGDANHNRKANEKESNTFRKSLNYQSTARVVLQPYTTRACRRTSGTSKVSASRG